MAYRNMQECLTDLEAHGHLKRIDAEVDPYLELAAIQRRAFRANAPAHRVSGVSGRAIRLTLACRISSAR